MRIGGICHGLMCVRWKRSRQSERPSSQGGDIASTDELLIIDRAVVECATIDHPIGVIDGPLRTLHPQTSQSHAEVLMFDLARTLGVSMKASEEEVRCLVREILAKEGLLTNSPKPPRSKKKGKGQREL